jgi:hypothetical protein
MIIQYVLLELENLPNCNAISIQASLHKQRAVDRKDETFQIESLVAIERSIQRPLP